MRSFKFVLLCIAAAMIVSPAMAVEITIDPGNFK